MFKLKTEEEEIEAVGYVRQSDEREDKEDISEQTQRAKIKAYCDFNNIKLVEVFKDIDYSGFRISYTKRPGIMEAFKYCREHPKVKKFVVFNLSRLTRRKKDFHLIHSLLSSIDVDICSASEQLDFGTATGRLLTSMLVDFNEYYSDNLSDVMNDNKATNAEKGRWNGGPAPYGLKKNSDGGFTADGEKAITVKTMFRMTFEGKGPYLVAAWLRNQGILTETGVHWTPRRVRYVLKNVTYAGMQRWKGKFHKLANTETLISWEEFEYLQKTRFSKDNVWRGMHNRQLLSTLLRCPDCGSKMSSRKTTATSKRRYICDNKNSYGKCTSPNYDTETLDSAVIGLIGKLAKERYQPVHVLPELSEQTQKDQGISSIKKLQNELTVLEQAKQKVYDDYYLHQKLDETQFNSLMSRYDARQKDVTLMLEKIPLPTKTNYGDYDDVIDLFAEALDVLEPDEKRKAVGLVIQKVIPGNPAIIEFRWGEKREIPASAIKYGNRSVIY
ncbi:Site-specific DNA recombinase [Paenibacillaceae bacterium GAS479]|nr:Site-specific DNA recombinase [Paenibacillaceae bacterium GAS479]